MTTVADRFDMPHDADGDGRASFAVARRVPRRIWARVVYGRRQGTVLLLGLVAGLAAACGGDSAGPAQPPPPPLPNRAPTVVGTLPAVELAVGEMQMLDLSRYFSDPDGDALGYASETSDEAVATVSVSGSTLTVRAGAKGRATIFVTAADPGGLTVADSFNVTVPNQAPAVTDTIPAQTLTVGEVLEWTGSEYFADPDGDALTYAAGTTDASIVLAIVSGGDFGIVAVAPGTATVTVTATDGDGLSAGQAFRVTVRAPGAVIIRRVEPTVLLEGAPATIRGDGFDRIPGNNIVLVGGLRATVTAASSTSLSITVPYADCLPPRQAELRVTASGSSDTRPVGVTPLGREDLDLPQGSYKVTRAGDGCLHLPGDATGGDYLIGVVSTSEVPSSLVPVSMTSTPGDATVLAGAVAATEVVRSQPQIVAAAGLSSSGLPPLTAGRRAATGTRPPDQSAPPQRDWERHNEIMASNEDLLRRVSSLPRATARARQSRALVANDTLTLFTGFLVDCANRDQLRGVVRFVGESTVWIDDVANPSGTFTNSEFAELDAFYASHLESVYDDYYGSLSDVDANEQILILMTKDANRQNLGGWVAFWDLLAPEQCGTSNHAEMLYIEVPDPGGVLGNARTKQQVLAGYPALIAHEVTHIVQAGAAISHGARFESWELEGGAVLAEQLVAYRLFGHRSGQDLGYAEWQRNSSWYHWVRGLARFFGWDSDDPTGVSRIPYAPEQCGWIGHPSEGNDSPCRVSARAAYDVPSLLYRYALDRWGTDYTGGEHALMRDLSRSERGLSSLAKASGWPIEQVLADFYVTLWVDLNGGEAGGMTSWDLADIWRRFGEAAWLRPYTSTAVAFQRAWSIRAGSTFYLRWTPGRSRGPTSLKVTSPSGAPVPDHMSVWALRIR